MFSEPRKRRLHLVDKHKYPKYFPFDLVYTGTLSFEQRKIRDQTNKERLRRLSMDGHKDKHKEKDVDMDGENKAKDVDMDRENKSQDVDMDELVANMSKLKIPKSISFGHRTKPNIPQHRHHNPSLEKNDLLKEEVKVYAHPRKRGPKKKKPAAEPMIE